MADATKGHRQRLKERFIAGNERALSDEGLLELLLTYAIPQKDVRPLAEQLLTQFGDLPGLLAADMATLCAQKGIGEQTAVLLKLVHRLGTRHLAAPAEPDQTIANPAVPWRRYTGRSSRPAWSRSAGQRWRRSARDKRSAWHARRLDPRQGKEDSSPTRL